MSETVVWYCQMVRRKKGRTWYRADSASTTDRDAVQRACDDAAMRFPQFDWMVGETDSHGTGLLAAPRDITRVWDHD